MMLHDGGQIGGASNIKHVTMLEDMAECFLGYLFEAFKKFHKPVDDPGWSLSLYDRLPRRFSLGIYNIPLWILSSARLSRCRRGYSRPSTLLVGSTNLKNWRMPSNECATQLIHDLTRSLVSALCVLVWENLITLEDEVEHIWRKPSSSWVKWVFLCSRYFSLATQLVAVSLSVAIVEGNFPAWITMKTWYFCQVLFLHINMSCAEIVLMARVYALYNRHKYVYYGLGSLLAVQSLLVLISFGLSFNMPQQFILCDFITGTPRSFVVVGACSLAIQATVLVLTLIRYFHGEWWTAPIANLMVRDGCIVFGVISIASSCIILYNLLGLDYAFSTCVWLTTFLSVTTCRIILNLQRMPFNDSPRDASTALQLTTLLTNRPLRTHEYL